MTLSSADYKARARALKKSGFVEYDLRRAEFTKSEKARIRKLYSQNVEIIQHPENFVKIRAGKKTRKAAKVAGIVASKSALYIPKGEFTSVKITHRKGVPIIVKKSGEKSSVEKLISGVDLLAELEKMGSRRLPPDTTITVRIGKNSPFKTAYTNPAHLLYYITTVFQPGDEDADIDELIAGMSLVTYHGGVPDEYKHPPRKNKRARGMTHKQKQNFGGRGNK